MFILAVLPFHAVLTNWAASNFGAELLIKAWKELILLISLPLLVIVLVRDKPLTRKLVSRAVNKLIIAFVFLHLVIYFWQTPDPEAALAGFAFNLRFLAMFCLAQVLIEKFRPARLRATSLATVLICASVVAVFGALQVFVLPNDILTHVGYGFERGEVRPYMTIDENPDYVRINSTLRGPNPLGAYMAAMLLLGAGYLLARKQKVEWWHVALAAAGFITLWASYSRSAAVGLIIGGFFCFTAWGLGRASWRPWVIRGFILGILLMPVAFLAIKDTSFYDHVILHNNRQDGRPKDSNSVRIDAYTTNLTILRDRPFGQGPGTAGTASFHNKQQTQIAENHYIQIAQEVGLFGLAVFLGIISVVGWMLWQGRSDPVQLGLLGGLIATSVVSLFLHGWQDETLAMTWWALAGLYVKDSFRD